MQIPLIEEAKAEGYRTIITDLNPTCVCKPLADLFEPVDIFDIPGHIALANRLVAQGERIAGVLAAGIDAPETMARLCEHLSLPGVSGDIAHLVNHKNEFREKLKELGYPTPEYVVVDASNRDNIAEIVERIGYPLIVKNTSSSGSRGTKIFYEPDLEGVKDTLAIAIQVSRSKKALIESVWVGHEITVETLFDCEGTFHPCFLTDRFFDKSQGAALETGLRHPAVVSPELTEEIYALAKQVATDLGITIGAAKYDMILTKEGPRIIEMTVRLSGGFDCQYIVPAATGKNVLRAAMLTALGKPFDPALLKDTKHRVCLSGSLWPEPGVITRIEGADQVADIEGFEKLIMRYDIGDTVEPYIDCTKRVCFIIVSGDSEAQAQEAFDTVCNTLTITTEAP